MIALQTIRELIDLAPPTHGDPWIIDGGCHVGGFARQAIAAFPETRILSFEPDPDSWASAQKNLDSHGHVEIVQAALGARKGRAEFFRGPYAATNSLLPRPTVDTKPYYPEQAVLSGGTKVDVVTIDEACENRGIQALDLLKLDLQGGELAALNGATALLERGLIKAIVVEAVFVEKYRDQPLLWEIWRYLDAYGYTLYSLEDVVIGLYDSEEKSLRQRQWNQCDAVFLSRGIRNALEKQ